MEPDVDSNNLDADEAFILTRQCYYYIKYTFHKHQHHDASVDSLTTIHSTPKDRKLVGIVLLEDLKHSLVEMKRVTRDSDYEGLVHTKGIVSYAKSLAVVSDAKGLMARERVEQEMNLLDNLDTSLQVKVEAYNNSVQSAREKESRFHSIVILLFAMIAPITLVYRDQIAERLAAGIEDPSAIPLVKLIANMMGGRWEAVIFTVILIGFAIRWGIWPSRRPFSPPPLLNRFRYIIDHIVHSPEKGAILWWTMMIVGMILALSTASWILFGENLVMLD